MFSSPHYIGGSVLRPSRGRSGRVVIFVWYYPNIVRHSYIWLPKAANLFYLSGMEGHAKGSYSEWHTQKVRNWLAELKVRKIKSRLACRRFSQKNEWTELFCLRFAFHSKENKFVHSFFFENLQCPNPAFGFICPLLNYTKKSPLHFESIWQNFQHSISLLYIVLLKLLYKSLNKRNLLKAFTW